MTRLRFIAPLLGDAKYVFAMLAVALLFVAFLAGRVVVAVVQDVATAARRMWE
jgi:hypothetical protein